MCILQASEICNAFCILIISTFLKRINSTLQLATWFSIFYHLLKYIAPTLVFYYARNCIYELCKYMQVGCIIKQIK